jgi:hypothetical protein
VTGVLIVLVLAAASAGLWWRRHRRADALLRDLGRALALAADAEGVCCRLERRYTADLAELARVRRDLAPLLEHRGASWQLDTSEDGSSFGLAIRAHRTFGRQRLLTARGDHGVIAYDSFAEDARNLSPQPQRASALA